MTNKIIKFLHKWCRYFRYEYYLLMKSSRELVPCILVLNINGKEVIIAGEHTIKLLRKKYKCKSSDLVLHLTGVPIISVDDPLCWMLPSDKIRKRTISTEVHGYRARTISIDENLDQSYTYYNMLKFLQMPREHEIDICNYHNIV